MDHEEVGLGWDHVEAHARELGRRFLAELERDPLDFRLLCGVSERCRRAPANESVGAPGGVGTHPSDGLRSCNRIAESHGRETGDLRERPGDDHRPIFEHVWNGRFVARVLDEVVIGLVHEDGHIFGDAVDETSDLSLVTMTPVGLFGLHMYTSPTSR